jgi:hypothetical protein
LITAQSDYRTLYRGPLLSRFIEFGQSCLTPSLHSDDPSASCRQPRSDGPAICNGPASYSDMM